MAFYVNRHRERDLGSRNLKLFRKSLTEYLLSERVVEKKQYINDYVPTGKYKPGEYKVTDVMLGRVSQHATSIAGRFFQLDGSYSSEIYGYYTSGFNQPVDSTYMPVPGDNPLRTADLLRRSYAKITEDSTGLAETLGELGSCMAMVRKPLQGMRRLLKTCYYKRSGRRRSLKDASSAWLEVRYGWVPLYSVVSDIVTKGLPKFETGQLLGFTASDVSEQVTEGTPSWKRFGSTTHSCLAQGQTINLTRYSVRHYLTVRDGQAYTALRRGGSVFSIPTLAWNLTPFSFVVDWWFDVGQLLSLYTPISGAYVLGATYSVKRSSVVNNWTNAVALVNSGKVAKPFAVNAQFTSEREVYYRQDIPVLKDKVPNIDWSFSSAKRAIDAVALIIQKRI